MKPYVEVKYEYLYQKKKKKNPIISISTTTVLKMINNTDKEVSPGNQIVY